MTDSKLLEKIKKLYGMASSSNEHEAAAFMAKAQALMAEHGLDEIQLKLSDYGEKAVPSQFSVSKPKGYEALLGQAIATAFDCKIVFQPARGRAYANYLFIGHKDKVLVAEYAFQVLGRKLIEGRAKFVATLPACLDRQTKIMQGNGFCVGWVIGVTKAIIQLADKEDPMIDAYLEKRFANLGSATTSSGRIGDSGYRAGHVQGAKESLFRPMGERAETRRLAHG
jgi:hypothetical protein